MALGPGKYDDVATLVRERTNADGVAVIIFNGDRGTGFSIQADLATTLSMPDILESVARQMRKDAEALK